MARIDYNSDTTRFWYGFFRVLYWIGIILDTGGDIFCYITVMLMLGPRNFWYVLISVVLSLAMSFITLALMKYKVLVSTGFVQTRNKMYSDNGHGMRADAILPQRSEYVASIGIWCIVIFRICTNIIAILQISGKWGMHGDNMDAWWPEIISGLIFGFIATVIVLWNMYGDALIDTFLAHSTHRDVQNENLNRPKGSSSTAAKSSTTPVASGTANGAAAGSAYTTHAAHQPRAGGM